MAAKASPEVDLNDDVQIIRRILFGDQIKSIQSQLQALEKKVAALQRDNKKLQKSLSDEAAARLEAMKADEGKLDKISTSLKDQINNLEARLGDEIKQESKGLTKSSEENLKKVDQQFNRLRKELADALSAHEQQQENLISALAKALSGYGGGIDDGQSENA